MKIILIKLSFNFKQNYESRFERKIRKIINFAKIYI